MSTTARIARLALAVAAALCVAAPVAQAADQPFTTRFAQTVRGDIQAVGNMSLTCPASASCSDALNRIGATLNNNNFSMVNVDVDSDATTFNSSRATVSLPASSEVVWAGLYWGADVTAGGGGGSAAPNASIKDAVRLAVGGGAYQTVTAASADVLTSGPDPDRYRAFADVTDLLPPSGSAEYTVANIQAGTGEDRFAGWGLIVAYRDLTQDIRRLNVYDGLGTVDSSHTFDTTIAPFLTPATGPVDTTIGLLAFEGDAGSTGDTVKFNNVDFANGLNPATNSMNSTISVDGGLFTDKAPNNANQLGFDLDSIKSTGWLSNNQSSAVLSLTSGGEYFMPSALWLVSDEGPPYNTGGPSISGTAQDDSTLTADPGGWNGTPTITYDYQWQRCDGAGANCADIAGADDDEYTLTGGDVGSTIRVVVVATNDAGSSDPATSSATSQVVQEPPSNIVPPAVTGTAHEGQTLTSDLGTWDGTGPLDYQYRWLRCDAAGANCNPIPGATDDEYVLTADDVGHTVRSSVSASNDADTASAVSAPTGAVATQPVADAGDPPLVTGPAADGETLTADTGTWTGTPTPVLTYQWQRCDADGLNCVDIAGADDDEYELTGDDIGHTIVVEVTGTNEAGTDVATSAPSAVVQATPPTNTVVPQITGTVHDGSTLSADTGDWTGTDPVTHGYQWQRCEADGSGCVDIAGATGDEYTLTGDDVGHTIRVVVTGTNVAGDDAGSSTASAVVSGDPPVVDPVDPPAITGVARDGATLTADTGAWAGSAPMTFAFQWQRCDAAGLNCIDIAGATDSQYTLTPGDIGHAIQVVVTATNAAGDADEATQSTAAVAPAPPVNVTPPSFPGSVRQGVKLTADPGEWEGTGPLTYAYQWQRCDANGKQCVDIAGARGRSYTPTAEDAGHALRVVVEASNVAGQAVARSAPSRPAIGEPAPPVDPAPAPVDPVVCQQLAGNAKYRRVKLAGIGTVRVRAYTSGPVLGASPVQVTTRIRGGAAKAVSYRLDGRALGAARKPYFAATITPAQLQRVGRHTLETRVKPRRGKAKRVVLTLTTVECGTVFSAQRWRTTAGTGLRLRIDARTALRRLAFAVPSALLPRQTAARRSIGFIRVYKAGASAPRRFELALPRAGAKRVALRRPAVRFVRGGVVVRGLPAGTAVAELTIYRVTSIDGPTTGRTHRLRATVVRAGAERETLGQRPRAPR